MYIEVLGGVVKIFDFGNFILDFPGQMGGRTSGPPIYLFLFY